MSNHVVNDRIDSSIAASSGVPSPVVERKFVRVLCFLVRHVLAFFFTLICGALFSGVGASKADQPETTVVAMALFAVIIPIFLFPATVLGEIFRRYRGGSRLVSLWPSLVVVEVILIVSAIINRKDVSDYLFYVAVLVVSLLVYWGLSNAFDVMLRSALDVRSSGLFLLILGLSTCLCGVVLLVNYRTCRCLVVIAMGLVPTIYGARKRMRGDGKNHSTGPSET